MAGWLPVAVDAEGANKLLGAAVRTRLSGGEEGGSASIRLGTGARLTPDIAAGPAAAAGALAAGAADAGAAVGAVAIGVPVSRLPDGAY